jgi:hypothetical protein
MVNPIANQPTPNRVYSTKRDDAVLSSEPQFFVGIDPAATVEDMENAIWQNIGGHEIISLVRRDLVDGININYSLINNLKKLREEYNPQTIFSIDNVSLNFFSRFGLKLEDYVPSTKILSQISEGLESPVSQNIQGKGLAIYVANISDDQEVEVQIINSEKIFRDTIY